MILIALDIDEVKRAAQEIQQAVDAIEAGRDFAEAIVATVRRPLLVLDAGLRVHSANPEFYRSFSVSPDESEGRRIYELGNGQWNIAELRTLLEDVVPRERHFEDFEVDHEFPRIGRRTMFMNARRVQSKDGAPDRILLAIDDITESRQSERALQERDRRLLEADSRKNEFLAMLAHELRNPLAPIVSAATLLRAAQRSAPAPIKEAPRSFCGSRPRWLDSSTICSKSAV